MMSPTGKHNYGKASPSPQTPESIVALRCAKIIKPCHGSILQHAVAFIVARHAGHQVRYRVAKEHRRFLHATRHHCGISARIDRTLLKDAKRAARVVAARER